MAWASLRKLTSFAAEPRDEPIRAAACLDPPDAVETYCETARPKLRRSEPPELANRVRLLRAEVYRLEDAKRGVGCAVGAAGTDGAGVPSAGDAPSTGCVPSLGGVPPPPAPSSNQLGTRGVAPEAPPNELEVPIIAALPCACAAPPMRSP